MIQRVLGIIAGVDRKTLQSCPASDKLWATHLGASLCLSFVVVLGVSFHATGYMIDNIWTRLLVSTVIALTVLMFDRALCQSDWFYQGTLWNTSAIQSRAEAKQTAWRFVRVGIRLTLSFGLAWVIAMFLELAIFSSTINEKIEADRVVANQPVYDKIAAFEAGLNAEAKRRLADIEQLEALHRDALTEQPKPEPTTQARTEDIEQQIRALATREAGIRADIAEIDKTIQRYIADMNAEEFGLKATPNNSGRPGAGPRYEFARKQRQAFLAQRAEREAEIAQLHVRRDDLRAAQAKITTDALAAREQERVAIKARADALQQRIDAARADLKQFEVDKAASVADFRKKVMSDSYFQEKKDKFDPLTRIAAYQELKNDPRDGATMTLFSWMTRCFIIFLEIVPVVAKIFFSPPSVYAAKIQAQVERARQRIENNEDLDDEAPKPAPAPAMAAITLPAMALDPVTVAQPQAQAPKPQAAPAPEPARAAEPPPAPPRPVETARGFEHALHDDEADYDEMRRRDDRRAYEWRRYGGRDSDGGYDDYDPREFERREFARRHDYDRYDERPRRAAARRSPPQFVARDYAIRDYGGRDFGEPEYETSEIDVRNLIMPRRGSARREAYAVEPTARVRVPADDRGPARSAGLEPVAERSLRWPDGIPVDDLNTRELVRQVLADAGTAARAEPIRSEPAQAETTARVEPIRPVEPSPAEPALSEPAMIEPVVSEAVATELAATASVAAPATSTPEPEAVLTVAEAVPMPPQGLEPDVLPNVLTRARAVPAEQPTPSPQATASDQAATAGVVHPEEIGPLPKFSADVEKLMTDAVELSRPRKKAAHPRREHHAEGEAELPLEHKVRHENPPQA